MSFHPIFCDPLLRKNYLPRWRKLSLRKLRLLRLLCMLLLGGCAGLTGACAQTATEIWQDVNEATLAAARGGVAAQRTVTPWRYRTLRMNGEAMSRALARAPREFAAGARAASAEFFLPLPNGTFARCAIEDSPVFEAGFEVKHPQFKTYLARGLDDPSISARLDRTPQGFHAIIFSPAGTSYIDPYWRDDATIYIAYRRIDYRNSSKPFNCLLPEEEVAGVLREAPREAARPTGGSLRTYRLAAACTGEYAAAAGGGTVDGALAAIVTTVNRVSGLYERDFAIRLILIANNEKLIFTNAATDPYSNSTPNSLLPQNQSTCDNLIGTANYDIGHVFTTGGGGLASLGVVGRAGLKARGETGLSNPVGDPYDIDFVAHEMSHQFAGNHTFNGNGSNCGSNRVASKAYEPGSGTTIMAYAGVCSLQNLAPNSDDYFHSASYDEIDAYTSGAGLGNVGVATSNGNTPPTVGALANFTIPSRTPFALTATATDPDPDVLTYCWEEFDLGPAQNPTVDFRDNGASPIFRSFAPTTSPTRLFPSLTYILNNANVPPATIGSVVTGEFLPITDRTMNFRVTVRDNRAGGGGSNYGSMTVTSIKDAGPFAVTSFENAATISALLPQTITWNVANTTVAGIDCANVKISLSTDGGRTFPFVLAASTPNDGSEEVTLPVTPDVATTQGRFKVEAVGNIFFDISGADLTITSPVNSAPDVTVTDAVTVQRGTPTPVVTAIATATDLEDNTPLTATISDVPDDATITASITGSTVTVSALANCSLTTTNTSRTYPVTLTVMDSLGASTAKTFNLIVQPNPAPTLGTYATHSVLKGETLVNGPSIGPADANNNLSAAPFSVTPKLFDGEAGPDTITVNQLTGEVTASPTAAAGVRTYRVQVTLQDSCGAAAVRSFNLPVLEFTNRPPTLNSIGGLTIDEDSGVQNVPLSGIGAGTGETQILTVTAISNNTAVIPHPSVVYTSPNSTGSLVFTPVANASGIATITVTVQDDAGTDNGGVDSVSKVFTVTVNPVNDPPTLNGISNPARLPINAGEQTVNLSGITAGGGESQTLTVTAASDNPGLVPNPSVTYTSPNTTGTLTFTPKAGKSGTAIVSVKVSDGASDITRTFTITVGFADLLGVYNGLAVPVGTASVAKTGLLKIKTTKKASFTGTLKLGEDRFSLKGFFNNSGDVLFGKMPGMATLALTRKDASKLILMLRLVLSGAADHFTGTITADGSSYANLSADRTFYSAKNNPFPPARIVPYTAIFRQPIASGLPSNGFPHGDGFGTATLRKTGSAKIVARLADGTKFSYANFLSSGDFLPVWVPFFKGSGALVGSVRFQTIPGTRDFVCFGMKWFRPLTTKGPFPAGWTNGISTDLLGSSYIVSRDSPACLPTLEVNDLNLNGNAELTLSGGQLTATLRKALSIDPKKNKVSTVPILDPDDFKLKITSKKGLFSATFVHPDTGKKIKLGGAIYQQQKFGSGFFLSTDANEDVQTGGVSIVVDNDPLVP